MGALVAAAYPVARVRFYRIPLGPELHEVLELVGAVGPRRNVRLRSRLAFPASRSRLQQG